MRKNRVIGWSLGAAALIIVAAVALVVWYVPGYRTGKRLAEVEEMIKHDPDSALTNLRALHEASQGTSRNRALHALLTTMAIDKTGVYQSEDSLAGIAYDYFEGGNDLHHKMLSEYYVGQIELTNGRYAKALPHLMRAADLADRLGDNLNAGLAYRTIADLYTECHISSLELRYVRMSYDKFRKGGEALKRYADYSRLMLLYALSNKYNYREAYKLALDMLNEEHPEFEGWKPMCYTVIGYYYLREGRLKEALSIMEDMKASMAGVDYCADQARLLSMVYAVNGQIDSAAYYRDLTLRLDSMDFEPSYWTALYSKDYGKALEEANNVIGSLGKSLDELTSNQLPIVYEEYIKQKDKEEAAQSRNRILRIVVIGLAVLLIITAVLLYYRNKAIKRRLKVAELELVAKDMQSQYLKAKEQLDVTRAETENLTQESTEIRADLSKANTKVRKLYSKNRDYRNELEKLREEMVVFFYDKYHLWEDYANIYFNEADNDKSQKQLIRRINKNMDSMTRDGHAIETIADEMDRLFNGIVTDVVKDYHLTPKQRDLFVYTAMGFSSRTISYFTGQPIASLYSTRSQFKKLISSGKSKRKKEYLKLLRMEEKIDDSEA